MSHILAVAASSPYGEASFKALLTVHIIAAMIWVGGGIALGVAAIGMAGSTDLSAARTWTERAARIRRIVFLPAAVVLLGCGFGLVGVGDFSFQATWLDLAILGWIVSIGISTGLVIPASDRLSAEDAREPSKAKSTLHRIQAFSGLESVVLLLVVIDMVAKP